MSAADDARPRLYLDAQRTDSLWKNGGGTTREIVRSPEGHDFDDFDWRVSSARIESDGEFSRLPGVVRHIVNLGSSDVIVSVEGRDYVLSPLQPFTFSGDSNTIARLTGGAVRDVNVMCRRGRASASIEIFDVEDEHEEFIAVGTWTLLVVLTGRFVQLPVVDSESSLGFLDAVGGQGPLRCHVRGGGKLLVIRIMDARSSN